MHLQNALFYGVFTNHSVKYRDTKAFWLSFTTHCASLDFALGSTRLESSFSTPLRFCLPWMIGLTIRALLGLRKRVLSWKGIEILLSEPPSLASDKPLRCASSDELGDKSRLRFLSVLSDPELFWNMEPWTPGPVFALPLVFLSELLWPGWSENTTIFVALSFPSKYWLIWDHLHFCSQPGKKPYGRGSISPVQIIFKPLLLDIWGVRFIKFSLNFETLLTWGCNVWILRIHPIAVARRRTYTIKKTSLKWLDRWRCARKALSYLLRRLM